jgi:hypothetical protein
VHPVEVRRRYRREIAVQLWEERLARQANDVREEDFERVKVARLSTLTRGSDEAKALEALTWLEVADDLNVRYWYRERGLDLRRNLVRASYAANVAGVNHGDFYDALDALGFRTLYGNLDRKDVRAVLAKLLIRSKDHGTKDRIRTAIHVFADEPED